MGIAFRGGGHHRAFLAVVTQEAYAFIERTAVVFLMAAPVGTDVLVQVVQVQVREALVQFLQHVQAGGAADT